MVTTLFASSYFEPVINLYTFAELPYGGLVLHIKFAFPKLNGKGSEILKGLSTCDHIYLAALIVMFFLYRFVFEDQIEFIKASVMEGVNVCMMASLIVCDRCSQFLTLVFLVRLFSRTFSLKKIRPLRTSRNLWQNQHLRNFRFAFLHLWFMDEV